VLAPLALASLAGLGLRLAGWPSGALEYLAFFIAGIALDRGATSAAPFSPRAVSAANALALACFALPYVWPTLGDLVFHARNAGWRGLQFWEVHNVVLAVLLIPFVGDSVRRPSSARDRALGGISYALYLVHWGPLQLYAAAFGDEPVLVKSLGFAGYVGASMLAAFLLYRYVDRPLEALRRRWLEQLAAQKPERDHGRGLGTKAA
jgi:peptidoglycan/LPS O-acetylase OafA/YrhL